MKSLTILLLSLFLLAAFQFSFANTSSDSGDSSQLFATPEQTWSNFKSAIMAGDFEAAHKCCCDSKGKGVLKFKKMNEDKRISIIQSMEELTQIHLQENAAKYKLTRNTNGTNLSSFVYFEKIDNEWKIKSY